METGEKAGRATYEKCHIADASLWYKYAYDDPANELAADTNQNKGRPAICISCNPRHGEAGQNARSPDGHDHELGDGIGPAELG